MHDERNTRRFTFFTFCRRTETLDDALKNTLHQTCAIKPLTVRLFVFVGCMRLHQCRSWKMWKLLTKHSKKNIIKIKSSERKANTSSSYFYEVYIAHSISRNAIKTIFADTQETWRRSMYLLDAKWAIYLFIGTIPNLWHCHQKIAVNISQAFHRQEHSALPSERQILLQNRIVTQLAENS